MREEIKKLEKIETVTKDQVATVVKSLGPSGIGEEDERKILYLWERSEDGLRMVRKPKP